jgi:leucyl-tRNA synthetase
VGIDWKAIQEKWQRQWEDARLFEADPDPSKKKSFITRRKKPRISYCAHPF